MSLLGTIQDPAVDHATEAKDRLADAIIRLPGQEKLVVPPSGGPLAEAD